MSADNWTICPKCKRESEVGNAASIRKAEELYGKVTPAEYLSEINKAIGHSNKPMEPSLREDWGIGTDEDGNFSVDYSCSCDCGFRFNFKHEQKCPMP